MTSRSTRKSLRGRHTSRTDRHAARRALATVSSPAEILALVKGSKTAFRGACFMVGVLLEAAGPLPPALRRRLAPWLREFKCHAREILSGVARLQKERKDRAIERRSPPERRQPRY